MENLQPGRPSEGNQHRRKVCRVFSELADSRNEIFKTIPDTILQDFLKIWRPAQGTVFYPSSGSTLHQVLSLPYQSFFFADCWYKTEQRRRELKSSVQQDFPDVRWIFESDDLLVFETQTKRGYYFFHDNNAVLDFVKNNVGSLDCFIGVRDGCCEGGNYECVNRLPFIYKVIMSASPEGMRLIVDHSGFLEHYPEYIFGDRIIRFVNKPHIRYNRDPTGQTSEYQMFKHTPTVYTWEKPGLKMTIEYDNIDNHLRELDGIVASYLCQRICGTPSTKHNSRKTPPVYYFKPSEKPGWSGSDSLRWLLVAANKHRWSRVGTTAFGEGQHEEFIEILQDWKEPFPSLIRIFHVDANDFEELRKSLKPQK